MTQAVNDGFNNQQALAFLARNDPLNRWGNLVSSYMGLPALRGFWPCGASGPGAGHASIYGLIDQSGLSNHLSPTNTPRFGYENLIPYVDYNGTTQYHTITDAASNNGFDIIGNEAFYLNPGLTFGGWFRFDEVAATVVPMGKLTNTGGTLAYWMVRQATAILGRVSTDGTAVTAVTSSMVATSLDWHYIVIRFVPSTSLDIYVNDEKTSNTTSIPATIFNTAQPLAIGANGGTAAGNYMNGQASMCFVSAMALSDSIINGLYQQSKILYGIF